MKKFLVLLLCLSMVLSFVACSSSNTTITLNEDNIEEFLNISSSTTHEESKFYGTTYGYYNSYHLEFSPNSEYTFDNVSFDVEVYTTNPDYRFDESTSKDFVNGKECWRVGSSYVKLNGNNSLKQTFESMYANYIASESDYFYVIENISGTVSSGSSNNDNSSHVYTIKDAIYNTDTDNMFDEIEDNYAKITLSEIRDSDKSKLNNLHEQLGFTKGVVERMMKTSKSDGQLSEENSNYKISWSYSSYALTIIYEMK